MKILMFGWEFPPHISGGLGTACYGLTKSLTRMKDIDILFVIPKAYGDEDLTSVTLRGANTIPVTEREIFFHGARKKMRSFEILSPIIPYSSEEEFWQLKSERHTQKPVFVKTNEDFMIEFSGRYGPDLIDEIKNYALIAGIIAKNNSFDLIHSHDWLTYKAGIAAKEISGKPLIIHVHATEFDRSGGNVNPGVYAFEREGMEKADKIIAVSYYTKKIIVEKYHIPQEKIEVIHNAVEPLAHGKKIKLKKGIHEKIVTFLGRITMQKGPQYFVEAAYLVLKKSGNVRFVMAGSGDKMKEMIHRVADLGIADKFHFTGFLDGDDVNHLFQLTDIFVMPSVSEPFGIVPLEAMQAGVPVIISSQSGVSEVLHHAIKIDFWDTYAMADSIYGLIHYPSLSQFLRKAGKKEVGEMKWEHSAKKVKSIYMDIVKPN